MAERFFICFYHDKRTYRSEHQAHREAKIINQRNDDSEEDMRVFYCSFTGGYHHTSIPQAEMDRRQVQKTGGNGKKDHENFDSQRRRLNKTRTINPNTKKKRRTQ